MALLLSSPPNACRYERRRVWGLCPALLRTILAAAETGAPLKSRCAVAGISYETLRGWILEEPEIGEKLARARERARVAALRVLQEAWKKDWRAAAEFLRFGFREDYSARGGNRLRAQERFKEQVKLTRSIESRAIIIGQDGLQSLRMAEENDGSHLCAEQYREGVAVATGATTHE